MPVSITGTTAARNSCYSKRTGGNWAQLGNAYSSGPLAAGTQLKLMVVGSTLSFLENGVERIAVYDPSLAGGAPGIVAFGTAAGRQLVRWHLLVSKLITSARTRMASNPTT